MKNRMKINIAAVLLAVLMMCLVPVRIFAAGVPSLDEVRNAWLKGDSSIKLSDYYFIYNYTAKDRSGEFYDFTTITVVDDSFKGQLFAYRDDNSTPVGGNIYFMSFCDDKIITGAEAGVYVRNATYYNINGSQLNSASGLGGGYDMKYLGSDIMKNFNISDTNIPLFDSLNSAKAYFETGDTSGMLNSDKYATYDASIEVPQNLKVDFSAAGLFDDKGRMNLCDFNISWNQSDNIDLSNYKTEIYMQPSVHFLKAPYIGQHWQSQLGKKVSVASVSTSVDNSYLITEKKLGDYFIDATSEVTSEGVVDGSVAYFSEPLYIYVRNVVGNKYSDWIKVTVTPDNVTTEGTKIFNNGSGTVTSGYDQIKGDSSKGGGIGEAVGGSSASDSQYGKNYSIKVDDADLSSIAGHLKNGFGVLGDNGLIALLNTFFSFIPEDYFTVLVVFVSGCCAIGLLFLVLRR